MAGLSGAKLCPGSPGRFCVCKGPVEICRFPAPRERHSTKITTAKPMLTGFKVGKKRGKARAAVLGAIQVANADP